MARTFTWRPLACLPILKGSACTSGLRLHLQQRLESIPSQCAVSQRRDSAMAPIDADANDMCSMDRHFRFADKVVRRRRGFRHLLSLEGAEIAADTTCRIDNRPTCESPKDRLANNNETWELRSLSKLKKAGDDARDALLNDDGSVLSVLHWKVNIDRKHVMYCAI